MALPQKTPPGKAGLEVKIKADSKNGISYQSRLKKEDSELRFELELPMDKGGHKSIPAPFSLSIASPWLTAGWAEASGLNSFLYNPGLFAPMLLKRDKAPLEASGLSYARLFGFAMGKGAGLFAHVAAKPGKELQADHPAFGFWYGPGSFPMAFTIVFSRQPGKAGGPGWYELPIAPSSHIHGAGSINCGYGRLWQASLAGAFCYSAPNQILSNEESLARLGFADGWAGRGELKMALGRLKLDSSFSASSNFWRGLGGKGSEALKIDSDLSCSAKAVAWNLGYRYELKNLNSIKTDIFDLLTSVPEEDEEEEEYKLDKSSLRAAFSVKTGLGNFKASSSLSHANSQWSSSLDCVFKPAVFSFMTMSSLWKTSGFSSKRFDSFVELAFFKKPVLYSELGLSFLPEGSFYKYSLLCDWQEKEFSIGASISSDGWQKVHTDEDPKGVLLSSPKLAVWAKFKM
ncbi:hypothetical protein MASR2M29_16770 [Spirochaetota bacterium]